MTNLQKIQQETQEIFLKMFDYTTKHDLDTSWAVLLDKEDKNPAGKEQLLDLLHSRESIACDWVEEMGIDARLEDAAVAYWRYASREQVEALRRHLPHQEIQIVQGPYGFRTVSLFRCRFLVDVCRFCGIQASKYVKRLFER